MNLRRFWIGAGALTTFVVGVSLVAYTTGKFTSEAEGLQTLNVLPPPGASGNATTARDATDTSVTAGSADSSANTGTSAATNQNGTTSDAQTLSTIGNAANQGASAGATQGKTLGNISEAPAVQLKNFLQTNFASVDSILRIGIPRLLVSFAGLITLVMFLINATKFLFSAGNEQGVTEAKRGMAFAGIGFAIVIFAYLIISLAANIFT